MIDPFSWRATRAGEVMVERGGRVVMTIGGVSASRLLSRLEDADDAQRQLLLAKATGNYKRGNERR